MKLVDSELKVMDVLWKEGDTTARHTAEVLTDALGWNVNTTYTLIKRCIKKGAIERSEPNFMCHSLIPKENVQETETNELIDKIYDGSADKLFAALLSRKNCLPNRLKNSNKLLEIWNEVVTMSLLQMSFAGAIIIFVVVVIRALAIDKLPKKTFLALWGVAQLRLLVPFSLPSTYSAYSVIAQNILTMQAIQNPPATNFFPAAPSGAMTIVPSTAGTVETGISISIWMVIWAIGAFVCFLFFAVSYVRCHLEFQAALPSPM